MSKRLMIMKLPPNNHLSKLMLLIYMTQHDTSLIHHKLSVTAVYVVKINKLKLFDFVEFGYREINT